MSRKIPEFFRSLLVLCLSVLGASFAAQAQPTTPDEVINQVTTTVRTKIGQQHELYTKDKAAFYGMVDDEILPYIDTVYVAKVILGQHLKDASPEQVGRFENAFKSMLMRQYADKLLQYFDSVQIETKPAKIADSGDKASVDTQIMRQGKPPVPLIFSLRKVNGQWRVWDIKAENISLVLNFRTQIDAEVKKSSVAEVIDRLENGALTVPAATDDAAGQG